MTDKVTVLLYAHINKKPAGSVVEYENGPEVHRLLRSGKVGLVDPPALEMIDGFEPRKHIPSKTRPVYQRPERSASAGSGTSSKKRSSGRNSAGSGGSIGEVGPGPSSGPTEGLTDNRIYDGQGEESS